MTKNQQLKQKIAEIIIKHLGVCDKESPEEILRLFEEEVLQIKKEVVKEIKKVIPSLWSSFNLSEGKEKLIRLHNKEVKKIIDKI